MRRRFASLVAMIAVSGFAVGAYADLSLMYQEFSKGPARYLMTKDEQRAWKDVKSDEEAQRLVDLFWARRDPTPGTPRNEFREDFEARVKDADHSFGTKAKRGSLTDMGRVYILLGPPKGFKSQSYSSADTNAMAFMGDPAGGSGRGKGGMDTGFDATAQMGAKQTFTYDNPISLGLAGPVVFIESLSSHEYHLDPQQANVTGALNRAAQKTIVNADLKEVPEWASSRRQELHFAETHPASAEPVAEAPAPPPPAATEPPAPVVSAPAADGGAPSVGALGVAPAPFSGERGIRRFLLVRDLDALGDPDSGRDPLAGVAATASFGQDGEVGYAMTYCSPKLASAPVKLAITISGTIGKQKVNMNSPAQEVAPEVIRGSAGCGVIRGSIPLGSFKQGSYLFHVTVTDAGGVSSTSRQEFRVE